MSDEVQFKSPTTGKVQAVPPEQWEEALSQGYKPTTHTVMYSPKGERGMVPNEELRDYAKQGYQTKAKTDLESKVTGEGVSLKGAGGSFWDTLKGMLPSGNITPSEAIFGPAATFVSGLPQAGKEASAEYRRSRSAGSNPIAAAGTAGVVGAGSLLGVSNQQQQEQAEHGEGGQIIGESAAPAAVAAVTPLADSVRPGIAKTFRSTTGEIRPIAHAGARLAGAYVGHLTGIPEAGLAGYLTGPEILKSVVPQRADVLKASDAAELQKRRAAFDEMNKDFAKRSEKATKAQAKADKEAAKAQAANPNSFPNATSSAAPVGKAQLPAVPQGNATPFPLVEKAPRRGMAPPPTPEEANVSQPTSILSRGRTLYRLGEEPDMNNPVHVKIIGDLQTRSGADLRTMASAGDRFAAFVLRNMPRPRR